VVPPGRCDFYGFVVFGFACRAKERSMTEGTAGPTGPGTVLLDLGADIGALILYTPAEMDGVEIEISRDDEPGAHDSHDSHGAGGADGAHAGGAHTHRTHSQVRQRPMPSATKYAAVYPGLTEGQYTIWRDADSPAGTVVITGGQITNYHWPE
jgi:hypothetical protein